MACCRSSWIIGAVLLGFVLGIFLIYSLFSGSSPPRTRFIHRFNPGRVSPKLNPFRWASVNDKAPHPQRSPLPPLPTESLQFQSIKPYTDFLSTSSSYTEVEDAFYKRMSTLHVRCSPMPHLGRDGDGGWETCLAKSFRPMKPCLVYDFGVNNVWEFDEVMARSYGCTVRAFDPSMGKGDFVHIPGPVYFYEVGLAGSNRQLENGWRVRTLRNLMKRFREQLRTIDVLKMDIEYYEWEALEQLLTTRILQRTKQLLLEVHTNDVRGTAPSKKQFLYYHRLLDRLEALGFRKFYSHANPLGKSALIDARSRSNNVEKKKSEKLGRTCCFELYYINIHFAKDRRGLQVLV